MNDKLNSLANVALKDLSAEIGRYWVDTNGFGTALIGIVPSVEDLETVAILTDHYTQARKAYETGNLLACIEIAAGA